MEQAEEIDFSSVLLYRQNNAFIEGDKSEPHSHQEILDNIESQLGLEQSRFAKWRSWIIAFVLFIVNLLFAFVVLVVVMLIFNLENITDRQALIIMVIGYALGWGIISVVRNFLPQHLLAVSLNTPAYRKSIYKTLIEKGEVVNGIIVNIAYLSGHTFITYTVKTPDLKPIQHTHKTYLPRHNEREIGQEVAVLYLNETINVLL